ncbi:unnamed protein product [Ceutorhynchus assimilis]|uniref:Uncharacterized protein n=1 Tax=Ceutorhynchus assimilis TaxID=467358 RepID=A0A9N9N066_9CUCU|nr:unnamed protein product [Ceutorhynchus assimilis]
MDTGESEDEDYSSSSSYEPSNLGSEEDTDGEGEEEVNIQAEEGEEEVNIQAEAHSPPRRGRKRVRNESSWKKNVRKRCRNEGEQYVSSRGREVPAKSFQNINCGCKKMCNNRVNENERKIMHDSFWKLGDFSKQNTFIHGLIKSESIKQKRPRDNSKSPKSVTYQYSLKINNINIPICKKFFLQTFEISDGRLYRILAKKKVSDITDGRGKKIPANKINDLDVIEHIKSFPAYQSHYSRKDNPNRKYLNPNLSIHKMYEMYVEKCTNENKMPVKEKFYYKVFSTKFNLHFKPPIKDSCRTCDELHLKLLSENNEEIKTDLQTQKNLHIAKAKQARDSLNKNKNEASDTLYVATFDLQKALPFPQLSTSVAYYKRNMYIYNFGVHSFNLSNGFMYMWDETEGGRGSQDIASCLVKHLMENAREYDHIILYSDSCTGQNRNIKLALTLLKLVQNNNMNVNTLDLKFLVSGHSFLPNDADFGVVEKASRKHSQIHGPEDWIDIVKGAKRTRPFQVFQMKRTEFLSTKSLEDSIKNRKKNVGGETYSWLKIRWFRFERDSPFKFKYKETLNEMIDFNEVSLAKAGKGKQPVSLPENQDVLYPQRRIVTQQKKRDMLDLLPFIPPIRHAYFKNLPTEIRTRQAQTARHETSSDEDEWVFD